MPSRFGPRRIQIPQPSGDYVNVHVRDFLTSDGTYVRPDIKPSDCGIDCTNCLGLAHHQLMDGRHLR
jgi:hypothetical protein